MSIPEIWTQSGFAADFADTHRIMENRSFAFVLGAGASVTSGIPSGGELARRWITELHELLCTDGKSLEDWATADTLGISGFHLNQAAEFYPYVFHRRFRGDREHGYAYLEHVMERIEPSYGYSVLAQLMSETRHRIVITTNFDNLVADAISIYGSTYPLIAGHESLTGFVSGKLRRPLVAKIHRDLFLEPKNDPEGVAELPQAWQNALFQLMREYTPIFIGYGGNDGSLMGFLEALSPGDLVGRLRWCFRAADGLPPQRVLDLVNKHEGVLIPIQGFDELMLLIGNQMQFGLRDQYVRDKGIERADLLAKQFENLATKLSEGASVAAPSIEETEAKRAVEETLSRTSPGSYFIRVKRATTPETKISLAREAFKMYPGDGHMLAMLALHLSRSDATQKEFELAKKFASLALRSGDIYSPMKGYLRVQVFKDYDAADADFKDALENDPDNIRLITEYAELCLIRGKPDLARHHLKMARVSLLNGADLEVRGAKTVIDMLGAISALMSGTPIRKYINDMREHLDQGSYAVGYRTDLLLEAISTHLSVELQNHARLIIACAKGEEPASALDALV